MLNSILLFLYFASLITVEAFTGPIKHAPTTCQKVTTAQFMAPRFDKREQRWFPSAKEEASEAYGPVGSLIRQGPKAFFARITNAEEYEQGVYKMMAQNGWDRLEAQGNMDAFLENPQDWMFQKAAEKKGAPKYDYGKANTSPKQIILTVTWAGIVVFLFSKVFITNVLNDGSTASSIYGI